MNEYGDALFFGAVFADQVSYDHTAGEWYLWGGHAWRRDATGKVRQLIAGVLGSLYLRVAADLNTVQAELDLQIQGLQREGMKDSDTRMRALKEQYKILAGQINELHSRGKALRSAKRMADVSTFVQAEMGITSDMWDTHPWLLAGQARSRHADCLFAATVGLCHHRLDDTPPISDSLRRRGSQRQRYTAGTPEGRAGRTSGPSVMMCFLPRIRLRSAGSATPHLVDLQGKRLVWGSETKEGDRLNIAQIKLLTGGGEISARKLHGHQFTFIPTHKLLLMTNYKPHADARDKAFWSRACLIEFACVSLTTQRHPMNASPIPRSVTP